MQSVALLFKPINFMIVAEEGYADAWRSWNRFLTFAAAGLILFVVLALVLTRATLRAVDFSNQLIREKEERSR